jgi:tRNA G10  N-methylase Trm11
MEELTTVWTGRDSELLERMIPFYLGNGSTRILDATVNRGWFWRKSDRLVVGVDLQASVQPTVVADNRALPFQDGVFDLVVYDPPHIPDYGSREGYGSRCGLGGTEADTRRGSSLSGLYPPFLSEAHRVLRPEGLVFAKVADYIHNHRRVWAHMDFVQAAQDAGFTACDCIVKTRTAPGAPDVWKTAHHARSRHVYWIVLRNSARCERAR